MTEHYKQSYADPDNSLKKETKKNEELEDAPPLKDSETNQYEKDTKEIISTGKHHKKHHKKEKTAEDKDGDVVEAKKD